MKAVAITAFAAWAAVAAAATNFTHLDNGQVKPWADDTYFTNHRTGRMMKHYVSWSNGTHFTDPATSDTVKHFDCDVHQGHASEHYNRTIQRLHLDHQYSATGSRAAKGLFERNTVATPITIPLYIHIITKIASSGKITQAMANAQATAMNAAYKPYGITFVLKGTTFTVNDAWAVANAADMDTLKKALRVGTYSTLNLYFHSDLSGGVLGTCTLPSQVVKGMPPALYFSDGCNINANTMPGGSMTGYNQGKTAVHETGHWLGLLHTFEGYSCSGSGDSISDTTPESASTNGCPISPWKSSCPGTQDPVHNYMDYSTDACYSKFTPGQVTRISTLWTKYRNGM